MSKFEIHWTEVISRDCKMEIEASTMEEAEDIWQLDLSVEDIDKNKIIIRENDPDYYLNDTIKISE